MKTKLLFLLASLLIISFLKIDVESMSYDEYTKDVINLKENVSYKKACSINYKGKLSYSEHCYFKDNGIAHVQTCGNPGLWCWIHKDVTPVKAITRSFCNGDQKYKSIHIASLIVKSFIKKDPIKTIPNCITGI